MIPKIKKKLTSFLLSEEGKISKQSLLSLGSFISAAVIGGVLATKQAAATHVNDLTVTYSSPTATGVHTHHGSSDTTFTACTAACGGLSACGACACACACGS
jgi:hypothetical protein